MIAAVCRAATLTALVALSACARPVGDFNRAAPSFTNDVAMPTIGDMRADAGGEQVSHFNKTDEEDEMHNRVWRFLIAPHAKDWFFDVGVELKRTRIGTASDTRWAHDRYYKWIKKTEYQSSRVRYATMTLNIETDIATVPDTMLSICRVIEIDRQRATALSGLTDLDQSVAIDVAARKTENDDNIDWFVRALNYRYDSYSYALDHLLVETPHQEARTVDLRLKDLSVYVSKANVGDFCLTGKPAGYGADANVVPSRYAKPMRDPELDLPPK
jgi:hypothetical protein